MKEDYVTQTHFDKKMNRIDKKFDKIDKQFDSMRGYIDEKIDTVLEAVSHGFEQNALEHKKMNEKIDTTRNLLDGYIKSREDSEQEFVILKERVGVVEKKVGIER